MTRINIIPVHELTGKHLVAEYRELPRVPNMVLRHQSMGKTPSDFVIPPGLRVGQGPCDLLLQ